MMRRKISDTEEHHRMLQTAVFLKPTAVKLFFLVEWTLFILLGLLRGELTDSRQMFTASLPLVLFYLAACVLTALYRRTRKQPASWNMLAPVIGLTLCDQLIKAAVVTFIPYQTSIPIIKGWLHAAHECNVQGSWLVSAFNIPFSSTLILGVIVVLTLLCVVICYRYYVRFKRRSVWTDTAFIGLSAGLAGWLCDMGLRGHIVDYIHLPGVVTADLKDILLTLGVAAFFAEALQNPDR